ncbi:MAG TPA: MFS transporter [Polyangiaceae bacterium]|nr:MFS transporter [Polyangiaceae bacterium]
MKSPQASLLPIFLIVAVDVLALTIMLPLLPFYAEHFGASPSIVGVLVGTYALCQLVAGPVLGQISDRVGRKPVLAVSQIGTCAGLLLLAWAPNLALVFVARVLDGLTAGNLSTAQAYIADTTPPKERARAFALIGIAFGIGFLVGPGASGYLASHFGFRMPIFGAAGLSFLSILGTTFLLPNPSAEVHQPQPEGGPAAPGGRRLRVLDWGAYVGYFRRPVLGALLFEFFLFTLAFAMFTSGAALFAERRYTVHGVPFGPKEVGYIFMYSGFMGIIVQGSLRQGALVRAVREPRLVLFGFAAAAAGYAVLGASYGVGSLVLAATIASFGTGVLRPVLTSLITQHVDRHEQGVVLGLNQSLQSVSQIVGPVVAGALIDRRLLTTWALVAAAILLVGVFSSARALADR